MFYYKTQLRTIHVTSDCLKHTIDYYNDKVLKLNSVIRLFRSQLATIVMAGINGKNISVERIPFTDFSSDVAGVCVGGVLGHFICTGLAVLCGALIAKKISVRMVTLLGTISYALPLLWIDYFQVDWSSLVSQSPPCSLTHTRRTTLYLT